MRESNSDSVEYDGIYTETETDTDRDTDRKREVDQENVIYQF